MSIKGKKNVRFCEKCGRGYVDICVDDGVNPMMTRCPEEGCDGYAISFFYKVPDDWLNKIPARVEWYAPGSEEIAGLKPMVAEHVSHGGLLSRNVEVPK